MDNEKQKMRRFVITFQNDDSSTTKYVVNRPNFYEAKQEAIDMQDEVNSSNLVFKIKSYEVKEET